MSDRTTLQQDKTDPILRNKILEERIRLIYRSLPLIVIVTILASILFAYTLREVASSQGLLIWLLAFVLVSMLRLASFISYRRHFKTERMKRYAIYFISGSASGGLLLGFAGVIFFPPQSIEHQYFILVLFAGMGVAALSSLHAYLPTLYTYLLTLLTPVGIKMLSIDDSIHMSLGIMVFAFLAGLAYTGFTLNRTLMQTLNLRFENINLIKQLKQQKKAAESANIAKSKFLAAASHDLRQPLHALTLFTSVLNDSNQSLENRKIVDQIDASVHALEGLFNSLLDISRLDAGAMRVDKEAFSLSPIFLRVLNDLEPQASAKQLRIIQSNCDFRVFSDPTLLEQILRNYLSNAIRYTYTGEIRIECETVDAEVIIKVCDTGIGIPQDQLEHIFDEFHQLNNPERDRRNGLGLGLSIVKRTAELLGHRIYVKSEYGKGSIFSISVELAPAHDSTIQQQSENDNQALSDAPVLFVVLDDESSARDGMYSRLHAWGCDVIISADQDEAVQKLRQINRMPDGIISDYRLRDNRNGIDAIRAIHAIYGKQIPALIVTGDTENKRLRVSGSSEFQVLYKPVAPLKLRTFLRHVQRQHAAQN